MVVFPPDWFLKNRMIADASCPASIIGDGIVNI
jgi:hypothetical protein